MLGQLLWVNGRNGRGMYWLISVVQFVVILFLMFGVVGIGALPKEDMAAGLLAAGPVVLCIMLTLMWVGICNVIRRYHDRNKSGWWYFMCLIPLVGPVWQFVELGFMSGDYEENDFGPPPGEARRQASLDRELDELRGESRVGFAATPANGAVVRQTWSPPAPATNGAPVFGKRAGW